MRDALQKKLFPFCPRCGGYITNNETPGAYPGALSRIDNQTEICSACGEDEALEEYMTFSLYKKDNK